MSQWINGSVVPGGQPTVALIPAGDAWSAYPHRTLHLGMDVLGVLATTADVRVAVHNGTEWYRVDTVTVTAPGGTVDVEMAAGDVKVSMQTLDTGVSYAIETW